MAKTESTAVAVKKPENDNDDVPDFKRRFAEIAAGEGTLVPKAEVQVVAAPAAALTNVVRLVWWPDAARAVPNGVLRSALFGVLGKGPRRYLKVERVAALEGIEIFYTGEQLDQGDLDVWLAVLHLCRTKAVGELCFMTAYELLKLLGRANTGGKSGNREVLDARLNRLQVTGVRIRIAGRYSYQGPLLAAVTRDEETRRYIVKLDPEIRTLFESDRFTNVEWAVRQELDGKPLAQWLHGFFSTHAAPHPFKISTLRELCGSEIARECDFKKKLVKALEAVSAACAAHGESFSVTYERDLVCIEREPSKAQRRHLATKQRKTSRS